MILKILLGGWDCEVGHDHLYLHPSKDFLQSSGWSPGPAPVVKSGKFEYTVGWLGGEPGSTGLVKSKLRVVVGQQAT